MAFEALILLTTAGARQIVAKTVKTTGGTILVTLIGWARWGRGRRAMMGDSRIIRGRGERRAGKRSGALAGTITIVRMAGDEFGSLNLQTITERGTQ